jgi:hypothetical protein
MQIAESKNVKIKKTWNDIFFYFFIITLSFFYFFQNKGLEAAFDSTRSNVEWYVNFSNSIFQPHHAYFAESILLPFLGKILGASDSLQAYKTLCAAISLSIIPATAIASRIYFNSTKKAIIFIILLSSSFKYFSSYTLGFPDPLAILFLTISAFQRRSSFIFICIFLAGLTHFSTTLLASIAIIFLVRFDFNNYKFYRAKFIFSIVFGLISAKTVLSIWFFIFNYKLTTRSDWIREKGIDFFIERFLVSQTEFWLTPGIWFLTLFFISTSYFLFIKRYLFSLATLLTLAVAYIAIFITVDGLRIFAVVISGAYAYILKVLIDSCYKRVTSKLYYLKNLIIVPTFIKYNISYIFLGIVIGASWFLSISYAKSKGLFINHVPFINNEKITEIIIYFFIMLVSISIFIIFSKLSFHQSKWSENFIKLVFLIPLIIIGIQINRQSGLINLNMLLINALILLLTLAVLLLFKIKMFELIDCIGKYIWVTLRLTNKFTKYAYTVIYKLS